jgi:hypothetical protein
MPLTLPETPTLVGVIQQAIDDFHRENDPASDEGRTMAQYVEDAIWQHFYVGPQTDEVFIKKSVYDADIARFEDASLHAVICLQAVRSRLDEGAQEAAEIVLGKLKEARDGRTVI